MTIPVSFNSTDTGVDPSWAYAINHFPASPYKFGTDLVFTIGPLGFILYPENIGWNYLISNIVRLLVWAMLIRELIAPYSKQRSRARAFFLVLSVIVAHPLLDYLFDYLITTVGVLIILRHNPESREVASTAAPLSLIMILEFLGKESGYGMLATAFVAYYVLWYVREKTKPSRVSLLRLSCLLIVPFAAYLLYNPSVSGLIAYLSGVSNIVSGYSAAMSLPIPTGDYITLGIFGALFLSLGVIGVLRKWVGVEVMACLLIPFAGAIRYCVVRHGGILFCGFGLVLFAALLVRLRTAKMAIIASGAAWLILCALTVREMGSSTLDRWDPRPHLQKVKSLISWTQTVKSMDAQTKVNLQRDVLPEALVSRVKGDPIAIFPTELSYGAANHLNVLPLYTVQSYAAFTGWLDRATAEHLSMAPQTTHLLVEWKSIDQRHPLLDIPATWETMYNHFEGELDLPDLLLLKKRESPVAHTFRTVEHGTPDIRQWQDIPYRDHAVSARIALSPTLGGLARRFFYKIDPVYVEFKTSNGGSSMFRVVPDVLNYPFVINCLPLDQYGLESLIFRRVCDERITKIRLSGTGLNAFAASAQLTFAEAGDAKLDFSDEVETQWVSGVRGVGFGDHFLLRGVHLVPRPAGLRVELYWESLLEQPLSHSVFVHLTDEKGKIVGQADHEQLPGFRSAPYVAKRGERWRDAFELAPDQLMGATRIGIGIWDPPSTFFDADNGPRDWGNRRLLIAVPPESRVLAPPSGSVSEGVNFGNELLLTGYSIGANQGRTEVELHWKASHKLSADYIVFVHALDKAGGIVFQADHWLKNVAGGSTAAWKPSELAVDRFLLIPPARQSLGTYTLRIGVYDSRAPSFLPVVQTTLPQPSDVWKGRAFLIRDVECK